MSTVPLHGTILRDLEICLQLRGSLTQIGADIIMSTVPLHGAVCMRLQDLSIKVIVISEHTHVKSCHNKALIKDRGPILPDLKFVRDY